MALTQTIPALPVRSVASSVSFYRDRLGFEPLHVDGGFAVVRRDQAEVNLWQAGDESWTQRGAALGERPVVSGAESFIAGTASCRIQVDDVDELFAELQPREVLHPVSHELASTDFGTREFAALDPDGNLLTFFEWSAAPSGTVREAIERGDLTEFRALLAPHVVWVGICPGQICRNREQVSAMFDHPENAARALSPEIVAEREGVFVVDPHADPQPEWVSQLHLVIVTSEHDRVVELRDYPDRASALAGFEAFS